MSLGKNIKNQIFFHGTNYVIKPRTRFRDIRPIMSEKA